MIYMNKYFVSKYRNGGPLTPFSHMCSSYVDDTNRDAQKVYSYFSLNKVLELNKN